MRKGKCITKIIISLIVMINFLGLTGIRVLAEEEKGFAGTRTVCFRADKSDVDNFVDGGKEAFDLMIRANTPQWLECKMSSDSGNQELCLRFEFESYEDYITKITELLTHSPAVVYSDSEQLYLIESHSAMELLNYFQGLLAARGCIDEKTLDSIFELEKNEITINEVDYQSQERISIRPKKTFAIRFDSLDIQTTSNMDGSFERKIAVRIKGSDSEVNDTLKARFGEVGTAEVTGNSDDKLNLTVRFVANNQSELIKKTMECLGTATSISERQEFVDESTVQVERFEFIDLEGLLAENGVFSYSHTFPSYVRNVVANSDEIYVSKSVVSAWDVSEIICQYQRDFKFSSVEIHTDLSSLFGKLKRTITLTAPTEIAVNYHEEIKKEFQKRLIDGSVFNIYDEGGKRYYEISISSFSEKELLEFSRAILNTKWNFSYSSSWVPFGESRVREQIVFTDIFPGAMPPDELLVSYKLPKTSFAAHSKIESGEVESANSTVHCSVKSLDSVRVEYKSLNVIKLLVEALPFVVIAIWILNFLNKRKKRGKE